MFGACGYDCRCVVVAMGEADRARGVVIRYLPHSYLAAGIIIISICIAGVVCCSHQDWHQTYHWPVVLSRDLMELQR